jgi:hypothetical protein
MRRRLHQWKNRMVARLYHLTHRIKTSTRDLDHLRECRHCREGFEKWEAENTEISGGGARSAAKGEIK